MTLDEFLILCQAVDPGVPDTIREDAIKLCRGDRKRAALLDLEDRWYLSLASKSPDFSVYHEPAYLAECWACWKIYSSKYLAAISKIGKLAEVNSIADLGCGPGITTARLTKLFPRATIIRTNIRGTLQFAVAERLAARSGFFLIDRLDRHVDLVFASEYFEHFERPVEHLREVVEYGPKWLVVANAFGARSIGHFETYWDRNRPLANPGHAFGAELRGRGYRKMETGFWNSRPSIWELS